MSRITLPTYRKVINRGFTPILYHTDQGQFSCWIERAGPKWIHVRFTDGSVRRVRHSELRYMKALDKDGSTSPLEITAGT